MLEGQDMSSMHDAVNVTASKINNYDHNRNCYYRIRHQDTVTYLRYSVYIYQRI